MTQQPEALRLADEMLNYWNERGPDAEAVAAELRRLHQQSMADAKCIDRLEITNDDLIDRITTLEAALEGKA